ncbi:helix-turn-helix domain-containing protein [Leifsonia naganoensis]|uniref:HTH cro/C1-type domain-containing protein n=1 Tax=Leifsonia naganoensis TaxID=150025 RepID=A0A853DHL4_9MICO|nr:helix-turn-helix transcriptional regulator [Leifsonia naganoensis]NYK08586.1 hypothetical protein [Leifsonia naganoensis]
MLSTVPTLLRHETVTPGAGVANATPAQSVRSIVCRSVVLACIWYGINRKTLAEMLGVSAPIASAIFRGTRNLRVDELAIIANAFDLPIETFFTDHDSDPSLRWVYDKEANHG